MHSPPLPDNETIATRPIPPPAPPIREQVSLPQSRRSPYSGFVLVLCIVAYLGFWGLGFFSTAFSDSHTVRTLLVLAASLLCGVMISVLITDWRGYITLDGLIQWRRIRRSSRVVLFLFSSLLFVIVVGIYLLRKTSLYAQGSSVRHLGETRDAKGQRGGRSVGRPLLGLIAGVLVALSVFILYSSPTSSESNITTMNGRILSAGMPTERVSVGSTPSVSSTRVPMQMAAGTTVTPYVGITPTPIANQSLTPTLSPTVAASPTVTSTPTMTPTPTDTPTPAPTPTPTPTTGVNGNPWGYDFVPGNRIYTTPTDFCRYFACISNFTNGKGYVVECSDGQYSRLGGKSGTCYHHGKVVQPLYSH